jgi:adenine-specific DNA-methyltransferase
VDYKELTREQAISLLVKRDAQRKLGLVWERDEIKDGLGLNGEFVVMDLDGEACHGDAPYGNLIIEADNHDALRWLRMTHAGRVKAIFIDPPYNTGKKDFTYEDRYVSREDRFRHSKWIEAAYQRLLLAKDLLRQDGVIMVCIGDDEVNHLGLLLDEVFGANNRIGTVIWHNATDNNPTRIAAEHEYVLVYAADIDSQPTEWKVTTSDVRDRLLEKARELASSHPDLGDRVKAWKSWFRENKPYLWPFQEYDDLDEVGPYTGSRSVHNPGKEGYRYDVPHPVTGLPCKQPAMGYRYTRDTMMELVSQGRIIFGKDHDKVVELKVYAKDYRGKLPSVVEIDGRRGANELKDLFPEATKVFSNPKPTDLVSELLAFVTKDDDVVLDFYAGSGTTGHAVARLNAEDGGHRRFILVNEGKASSKEPDRNICREVTAERVRRALGADGLRAAGGVAYLTVDRLPFEDITYDLFPERVWLIIQAMHGLPLVPYDGSKAVHSAVIDGRILVAYCDRFSEEAEEAIRGLAEGKVSFVYSWTPGLFREAFRGQSGMEFRGVPDEFVRKFES